MIVFHEGLPGSGKSYEALVSRIVPALAARRPVDAYVEGLDHAKIAQLAGITEPECRELLRSLTREEAPEVHKLSRDNALVVLDEAQNFWGNRAKLTGEVTQYVTEHRHRGQDIILMGQDLRDVHTLWRRRVEIKLRFMKLSALGASKRYSVCTFRNVRPDTFEKVGTQVTKYDPKYFGCYASHVSDDTNKSDYKEARATLWSSPLFRLGIPAAVLAGVWGLYTAWGFFRPEPKAQAVTASVQAPKTAPGASAPVAVQSAAPAPAAADTRSPQERRFSKLSSEHRIRLAGLVRFGDRVQGVVEWIDGGTRVVERTTLDQLRDLGVAVVVVGEGVVRLAVGGWEDMATMWPLEGVAMVSAATSQHVKPAQEMSGGAPPIFIGQARTPQRDQDRPGGIEVQRQRGG